MYVAERKRVVGVELSIPEAEGKYRHRHCGDRRCAYAVPSIASRPHVFLWWRLFSEPGRGLLNPETMHSGGVRLNERKAVS
jgi:hypothetical protein